MCLIVLAYKTLPEYYLVLAANRDEFFERPAEPAGFWTSSPGLLAGRDLQGGGTWLGLNRNGRFAAVTNYRDMEAYDPDARSRGELVTRFLESPEPPESSLEELSVVSDRYNGFNLLAGDLNRLYHYSNREKRVNLLEPGIHGLSNALMNSPWPKVIKAKRGLSQIRDSGDLTEKNLFALLTDTELSPPEVLPSTGLSGEMERAVSACFIRTPDYGTRNSTLLFITYGGEARFVERLYEPGTTSVVQENGFDFRLRNHPGR